MKEAHTGFLEEFDRIEFRGLTAPTTESSPSSELDGVIASGTTMLGRRRGSASTPDAGSAPEDPGGDHDLALSLAPLSFLGHIIGHPDRFVPTIQVGHRSAAKLSEDSLDISVFRSLVLAEDDGPFRVADLWLATDHLLKIRLEATPRSASLEFVTIRFYQPCLAASPDGTLEFLHEHVMERIDLAVAAVPLANPFLPLLIVAVSAEDELIATDLVPYPSLCRGGMHSAELAALGSTGSALTDLRLLGDFLVREFAGSGELGAHSIGEISIDAVEATGAEPIFAANMVGWLATVFGLELKLAEDRLDLQSASDRDLVAHLEARLKSYPAAPRTNELRPFRLTMPAHAVPTISALVSRRLPADAGGNAVPAPFLVSEQGTARPKWLVSLPPTSGWLNELQPAASAASYPTLTNLGGERAKPAGQAPAIPVAVFLQRPPTHPGELRLFPFPQDYRGSFLQKSAVAMERANQAVSIVVTIRERSKRFEAFLESAADQTAADRTEIVVVSNRSLRPRDESIRAALDRTFPGRHQFLEYDESFNHSAQINLGVSRAGGSFILVANSSVVFHDRRTMDVLLQLAARPEVATASCMLLHRPEGSGDAMFRSAGYFPGTVSFLAGPQLYLSEIECDEALPFATYPVVANSLDLTVISAVTWDKIGGLDERNFPFSHNDMDLAARLSRENLTHVCTTMVSAYCDRRRTRGTLTDVLANVILPPLALADVIGSATILRKL